jgi:co-chaperonin GroES (HSP10)
MEHAQQQAIESFSPLGDWVLIRLDKRTQQVGVIALPDREADRDFDWTSFGVVLAVGNGARCTDGQRMAIDDVKAGDRIAFSFRPSKEAYELERLFGENARLLKFDELEAVIES